MVKGVHRFSEFHPVIFMHIYSEIIDHPAGEVDRTRQAGCFDPDPARRSQHGLDVARFGGNVSRIGQADFAGLLGGVTGIGGRGGAGRSDRLGRIGVGVEIPHRHVPAEQDRHGQDPGQDHVAVVLLVHVGMPLLSKKSLLVKWGGIGVDQGTGS